VNETAPTASAPAFGPADWQAHPKADGVKLWRPNRILIGRLTLYAVLFLSAVATVFDQPFVVIGVVAAMGLPLLMFVQVRDLSVRKVLAPAHHIRLVHPAQAAAHYREAAVKAGYLSIDGERFDPAEAELMQVHRIHRTGEHMHRTHHVWLRTADRLFELGCFPLPAEATELADFFRGQLPSLGGAGSSSKADTLPNDARAVGLTVATALVAWGAIFAAPFLTWSWGISPALHATVLFGIGVGMFAIEAAHRWLLAKAGDPLCRSLRRRYRLGR